MADIFISYKREDKAIAERLSIALEQLGFDVWWDLNLISGQPYRGAIRAVIDQCKAAIVMWSTNSVESEFVMDEASYAHRLGKLCPTRIDGVELPMGFGQTHTVDLSDWNGELSHTDFQSLVRAVEDRVGRKGKLGSGRRTPEAEAGAAELEAFKSAQYAGNAQALQAFLQHFPRGLFANFVRGQLETMAADVRLAQRAGSGQAHSPPPPPQYEPPRAAPPPPRQPEAASPAAPKNLPWPLIAGGAAVIAVVAVIALLMPRPKPATEIAAEPAQVAVEEPQGSLSLPDARPDNAVTRNIDAELEAAQERARAEGDRRAEESAWSIARGADSIPGYEAYLGAFPNGQHAAEARRWISQRTRAQTPSTQTSAASATYDLALLNPQVRAAVERAREADRRGVNAAARARQAASEAEGFASRARNGESGLHSSSSTWGSPSMTARYEGQISGGVFSGYGVQVHTEGPFVGDHYAGQWRNDQRQGLGVYTFAENASNAIRALRYEGEWVDNDRTGSGVTHWRSLGRYSGGNSGGMKSGAGVFYFPDGRRYEGEWGSDSYNGYGVVWDAQGNVLSQGVWAGNNLSTALSR